MNYYSNDPRDEQARHGNWWQSYSAEDKTITVSVTDPETGDEIEAIFPMKFRVCGLCEGRGSHVNPAIDAHGISGQEFAEDPGFAEEYFRGAYDVTCYRCGGQNVEPTIDEGSLSEEQKALLKLHHKRQEQEARWRAEEAWERRMGA
jgi:hypothetical protein